MTLLVGVTHDERCAAVVHLAAQLARSAGEDLLLVAVVPTSWPPGPGRVDAEFRRHLAASADAALGRARTLLPDDVPARLVVHHARSAAAGLLEVAEGESTALVVLGSSAAGPLGRVALGSVADRLLHSSPVPVALATRGYRGEERVRRVTAAYGATAGGDDLVVAAAGVAARVGAPLRVASFAVHGPTIVTAGAGFRAEDDVVGTWVGEVRRAQQDVLARVAGLPVVPPSVDTVVGQGADWGAALGDVPWDGGDVLVVGSSAVGPVARVFLGSRASKVVRHSPVPVVVVPRRSAVSLAERAGHPAGAS
ncbi:universal stress protein [Vallicoccus soli]|uniref:Universal stress protein n=1 Tax=Vallicoccus soli TaxID=2339232 RepID=A0A3A3ZKP0_9ACTN|nr:universal stress protein [Vallicoccus soli]RJK96440.1 universal stress protein [Vallicoccus soli]